MKKVTLVIFVLAIVTAAFSYAESCMPGHIWKLEHEDDDTYSLACCVPVGDGSELSCTDGQSWWNEDNPFN